MGAGRHPLHPAVRQAAIRPCQGKHCTHTRQLALSSMPCHQHIITGCDSVVLLVRYTDSPPCSKSPCCAAALNGATAVVAAGLGDWGGASGDQDRGGGRGDVGGMALSCICVYPACRMRTFSGPSWTTAVLTSAPALGTTSHNQPRYEAL